MNKEIVCITYGYFLDENVFPIIVCIHTKYNFLELPQCGSAIN